jgi:hypothetical protein
MARKGKPASWAKNLRLAIFSLLELWIPQEVRRLYSHSSAMSMQDLGKTLKIASEFSMTAEVANLAVPPIIRRHHVQEML